MKTSQWVGALGVMILVIFGVTFIRNYVGTGAKEDDSNSDIEQPDLPVLHFPFKVYPYPARTGMPVGSYDLEYRKPGHQDFWFANQFDKPVRLGLVAQSCKCQGIVVFVMPEGEVAHPPLSEPSPLFAAPLGVVGRAALSAFVEKQSDTRNLEAKTETSVELKQDDPTSEVEVPSHRVGWVRMNWTGEKPGKQVLLAKLWMHHPGSGLEVQLERRAEFLDAVQVASNERVGTLRPGDLPRRVDVFVWSSTRKSFHVTKAEPYRPKALPASSDAFLVGEPVPLTQHQCELAQETQQAIGKEGRVLSAYRIPVTLQELAPDGKTAFESGNFRRLVEILTDASDKPLAVTFSGVVLGDVRLNGVDDGGDVTFGTFPRDSEPSPRVVFAHSETPGVGLEIVKDRLPEYLQARLTEDSTGGLGKTWKLEIRVLPGAYGPFPRDDDPTYRDSAVYVRTTGSSPQLVRVGVRGVAADR
jgi:hypothetical protein